MNVRHGNISSMQDEMAHPTLIGLETPHPVHWWEIAILAAFIIPFVIWIAR